MGYKSDFSPDGKLFALLDSDGKLKIWDTEDPLIKREYVPNLHLSSPCKCFVWLTVCIKTFYDKIRYGNKNAEATLYIALGTSKGCVELYSYATGNVDAKFKGSGHTGAVTSICQHKKSLFTSCEDCQIVEWSLSEGCELKKWNIGKVIPTCIVSLPKSNRLLVGCKELHLWSLEDYTLKSKFTGHAKDVTSMEVMQWKDSDDEFVVTTAKSTREISLWRMDGKESARATFLMEFAASFVTCTTVDGGFTIAAVTEGSLPAVHLFIVQQMCDIRRKRGCGPNNPKVTIRRASDPGTVVIPIPIVAATLNFSAKDSQNILIGYSSPVALRFENIPGTIVKSKKIDKTRTGSSVPLIDRVNVLSVEPSSVKAPTIVQLLMQGLHNHDAALLRDAFVKDEDLIRSTLKRLPTEFICPLVEELTRMAQKKTVNVQIAVSWINILLQTHASHLMTLGENSLQETFGTFIGILEHRMKALQPLSKLSGRLDFLLNQIERNTDNDPARNRDNVLIYEDDEASDDLNPRNDDRNSTDEDDIEDNDSDEMNGEVSSTTGDEDHEMDED